MPVGQLEGGRGPVRGRVVSIRPIVARLLAVVALATLALAAGGTGGAPPAQAAPSVQTRTVSGSGTRNDITSGIDVTIATGSATFDQFDPTIGTLTSATLSWNITGSVSGSGNYEADGRLAFAGRSATTHFESNAGQAAITFNSSADVTGAAVGTGTFTRDVVAEVRNHSGTFPWGATMSFSGTITLTYEYELDAEPPQWSVPGPITVATDPGSATATVTYSATATDNVGVASQGCTPASGSQFAVGATMVVCIARDGVGLVGTATFMVTVVDGEPPRLAPLGDISAEATSASGAVVTFAATAADAVDGDPTVACSPASGSTFPIATTTVTCRATDDAGNQSEPSTFSVTVADGAPTLDLPADSTVEATGPLTVILYTAGATDAVDGDVPVSCLPASATTHPVGPVTVSCEAVDSGNRSTSGQFTISVVDATAPTVIVPDDMTSEASGPAGAVVEFTATATDLVDGALPVTCSAASGSTFPLGRTTVECTATDGNANRGLGRFDVDVVDTIAPDLTVPDDITVEATGPDGAVVEFAATADDAVSEPTVVCSPASGDRFPLGTSTVTCASTDGAGNRSAADFDVTVRDTTGPSIEVPGDITLEATGPDGAVATYTATASDLVDGDVAVSCSPGAGSTFAVGDTEVECEATDGHGNTNISMFTVAVGDTVAPTLEVADLQAAATGPGGATVTFDPAADDLVDPDVEVVCDPPSGGVFALGASAVSCTATDDAGNATTDGFTVTVLDEGVPLLTVPADRSVEATGSDGAVVTFDVSATDDVDGDIEVDCTPATGSTFPLGTTDVACSATDRVGHETVGGFTVTVVDTSGPEIATPGTIRMTASTTDGAEVTYLVTAHDAVAGPVRVVCTPPSGSRFPVGTTVVSCTASDGEAVAGGSFGEIRRVSQVVAGNVSTASFEVVVNALGAAPTTSLSPAPPTTAAGGAGRLPRTGSSTNPAGVLAAVLVAAGAVVVGATTLVRSRRRP